ncbi:TonB-dependent receptor domain-containing protein [Novosphingobium jiangmenense]|uniref:TonB-dependent receptor n=1 Tax=Novosphingobium jiangmenense TaxID=2791981 RepID=A0ABS0HBB5_9SPHN|nr:TonB-dependent receptor [Novosphingobium jiangmenense]MBF9149517.1 TonB-dependent receptor [Novosphingobium jiangmenense]
MKTTTAFRVATLATASALSLISLPSFAQDTAPAIDAPAEAESAEGTIVVTGSRLQRSANETAPLPINTITSEALRNAGNTDATATLRQIPALISSGTVADSIERGGGGIGQATLNLRQLGSNRTLVVVDGYRHVSGVAGSQTVDVATIPNALIERVEVLTGGASAVYGADAVTGVVNYVMKKDFEGLTLNAQANVPTAGSGSGYRIEGTWGKNFAEGRGNITLSAGYTKDDEVLFGQRDFTRNNGRANNSTTYPHVNRRFQTGDISASATPNFFQRYSLDSGRYPIGFAIPTAAQFATFFPGQTPTAAEQALMDRAANSPLFQIAGDPRFAISSGAGLVFRRDFGFFNADINNNGVNDCEESYVGLTGFGGGGCYVTTPGGGVKIFQDGLISNGTNQFGGDGAVERTNQSSLVPSSERIYTELRASYEFSPAAELFVDAKYARNTSVSRNNYNTFYDSLLIFADNPFIPAVLQADADEARGLRISRDFLDLGPNTSTARRETYRIVGGLRGEISSSLNYELVGNYGRTDNAVTQSNAVRYDRLFAAIDVVRGPNGNPICRSDISNVPHPGSQFFPVIARGFFTFRPGDGQCRPANLFGGTNSLSQEAVDFITTPVTNRSRLEQLVITGLIKGDTGSFLNLPGGPVQFVGGAEYRKEKSRTRFNDLLLGLLPEGSPAGPAGTYIGDISPNKSLLFDAQTQTFNTGGQFDVKEVFGEVSLPVLRDKPFFHELSFGAAGRYADYSTIGGAFTWNVNGIWAPVQDIRFRGSYSKAIRAPNIAELFDPQQGATFRPADPCDTINQNATPNRRANCIAAATALGIPNAAQFIANYSDPLTARFSGTSGGNPNLSEETATTWTVGTVIQPRFIRGLTLSVDYYSIRIEDAIAAVSAQDIVNTCYDNDTFPNQFCSLFSRNGPNSGPTTFGFNFLRQTQINFGRIETSGIDATIDYRFALGANNFAINVVANWTEKLNRFFDPVNRNLVNPGLKETGAPEWSGVGSVTWNRGPITLNYSLQYIGRQAVASAIQIERIATEFGPAGMAPEYWVHNLAATVDVQKNFSITAGVNNLTDKEPFIASSAYPVSGIGRTVFVGVRANF